MSWDRDRDIVDIGCKPSPTFPKPETEAWRSVRHMSFRFGIVLADMEITEVVLVVIACSGILNVMVLAHHKVYV